MARSSATIEHDSLTRLRTVRVLAVTAPKIRIAFEILSQHLREHPHFPRGMLPRRADDIRGPWRYRIACHDRDQRAGNHISMCDAIGEPGDARAIAFGAGPRSNTS